MSDSEILDFLTNLSNMIIADEDKAKMLNYISLTFQKISNKKDKASDYVDNLLNDLK